MSKEQLSGIDAQTFKPVMAGECFDAARIKRGPYSGGIFMDGTIWENYDSFDGITKTEEGLLGSLDDVIQDGGFNSVVRSEKFGEVMMNLGDIDFSVKHSPEVDVVMKQIQSSADEIWGIASAQLADELNQLIYDAGKRIAVSLWNRDHDKLKGAQVDRVVVQSGERSHPLGILVLAAGNRGLPPRGYEPRGLFVRPRS